MPTLPRPTSTTWPRIPGMRPWPSDCARRRLTSALVSSANIVVMSVTPATISKMPNTTMPVGCAANEKSPKPTVATVSTVKYTASSSDRCERPSGSR